jgi:hypothetical protein
VGTSGINLIYYSAAKENQQAAKSQDGGSEKDLEGRSSSRDSQVSS